MSDKLSPVERIKTGSRGLRGSLPESLTDEVTGALRDDDQSLIKFHGIYQQDDRDRREERSQKKLEPLYSFMIRLRIPGGLMDARQWQLLHEVAGKHSTGTIKITTRQTVQLHGVFKTDLRPVLKDFHTEALDSIAACGDVNRNVVCSAHPEQSAVHEEVHALAVAISEMALPKSRAYYEIWIDDQRLDVGEKVKEAEPDPLYQNHYLPRKFKIAIAIPPDNDVDVFANDIGLIAILKEGKVVGYNVAVGGGLSTTHGNPATYARLGTVLGFVPSGEKLMRTVYEIITIQRDFGNRSDRKLARLKYTLDRMGVPAFRTELEQRSGFTLEPAKPYTFSRREDYYGWHRNHRGEWLYTLFVENGLIRDEPGLPMKTALLEIAATRKSSFRFTCNQNLVLSGIRESDKEAIEIILNRSGLAAHTEQAGRLRRNAIACVAFNTCPLALAEAQRYLPSLITKIEPILQNYGLEGEEIHLRMTGCPNGCGRPYVAEIGLIGTAYGKYNLHLGGDRLGERLNIRYRENLDEEQILSVLNELFAAYSSQKKNGEAFGDYAIRAGWVKPEGSDIAVGKD